MKPTFIMMFGLPGSGKSYLAERFEFPVVSSDGIRQEWYGDANIQGNAAEVFAEVLRQVRYFLIRGESVVMDATNLSRKRRKNFLNQLPRDIYKYIVVAATDFDVIYRQNVERERSVPEEVINKMIRSMQFPIKSEGWDRIIITPHPDNASMKSWLMRAKGFDQNNPHHSLDLYSHMSVSARNVVKMGLTKKSIADFDKGTTFLAAQIHDLGKLYTKTDKTYKGEITDCSHFYNHDEVGAYIAACIYNDIGSCFEENMKFSTQRAEDIISLVQWHMVFFAGKQRIQFFKDTYGERLYKMLWLLHDADIEAH